MRYLWLFSLLGIFACSTSKSNTPQEVDKNTEKKGEYIAWEKLTKREDWIGQKVVFEGKVAKIPHQHMMKGNFDGTEKNVYIDPLEKYNYAQIVGYYKELSLDMDNAAKNALDKGNETVFRFYGTIGKLSGAGKGGGTHAEYYIDLDKMQEVK